MKSRHVNILFCILSLLIVHTIYGQSSGENYVRESILLEKFSSSPVTDFDFSRTTVTYYDGLGRPIQKVKQAYGGSTFDLHELTEYDGRGMPYRSWLPVESTGMNGAYLSPDNIKSIAKSFYADNKPYTEKVYSSTPEQWEESITNPGTSWHDNKRSQKLYKGLNLENDLSYGCPRFDVSATGQLELNAEYVNGALRYEEFLDEDKKCTIKFYDLDNRLLLNRQSYDSINLDTYYVYNKIGQLTYVISPKAASIFLEADDGVCDTATVRKLCYHYAYDQYNRLIERRLPGAEPEYYVYDALDNVLMRQDGNLRKENKWYVTKLDHKYRKAVEGTATLEGETRASLQSRWGNALAIETPSLSTTEDASLYYSDTCGILNFEPLMSYFYDNYTHWTQLTGQNTLPRDVDYPTGMENAIGLLTGKAQYDGSNIVISSLSYDDRKRIVSESEYNEVGNRQYSIFNEYSFAGDLTRKKAVFTSISDNKTISSEYAYSYDYWGRVSGVRHRINNAAWVNLYSLSYDEVGRTSVKQQKPRKTTAHQNVNYSYTLHNRVSSITSPRFRQTLYYNDSISGNTPQWNGTPSAMTFTYSDETGSLDTCTVLYGYDGAGRLVEVGIRPTTVSGGGLGELHPLNSGLVGGSGLIQLGAIYNNTVFKESFSYDENGNPLIITRGNINGNPLIITRGNINVNPVQYLSLSYDGNQISSMNESKTSDDLYPDIPSISKGDYETGWSYDANGNRIADPSRGVTSITYNYSNQPVTVTFSDGSSLTNIYRSDGTLSGKTSKEAIISTLNKGDLSNSFFLSSKSYVGDFEVKMSSPNRVYMDGGYADLYNWGDSAVYHYYVTDYQGSVRAVIDENGDLKQATDYSAYGVPSTRYVGTTDNNRKHLGLEWQSMKGLYGYYNNARFRDAILAGTFYQLDPLAEKYYPFSPYHYGACNPLRFIDFRGEEPTPAEALRMSSHVYGDQSDDILIGGWSLSQNKTATLNNRYGLKSAVYERTLENGNIEYTYAFAGTQNITDILHDGLQLIGASGQYTQAVENLQALQEDIGSAELTLTGHSLGGGLAALGSMKTGLKALTFNAAGVSSATKLFNGVNMIKPVENNIDAYILATDPINLIQNVPFNAFPDVNGNINVIVPKDWDSVINGHEIQSLLNSYK